MHLLKKAILKTIVCLFAINCFAVAGIAAKGELPQTDPFAVLKSKGYQRVRSLTKKNGEFLGYVYVKENPKYRNSHVLIALLVVKAHGLKLDTLYQINTHGDFVNSAGKIELKNYTENYFGFKLYKEKKDITDLFAIGEVDSKGRFYSDDNDYLIDWDYDTKKLVYYPMP